jgi:hypothetical protein
MQHEGDNGAIYVGRDYFRRRRFTITVTLGRIEPEPPEGFLRFRHVWNWSPRWPITIRKAGNFLRVEYGFGWRRRIRLFELTA